MEDTADFDAIYNEFLAYPGLNVRKMSENYVQQSLPYTYPEKNNNSKNLHATGHRWTVDVILFSCRNLKYPVK